MVIVGYGEYKNYRVTEVPLSFLVELADRYKLQYSAHRHSDVEDLKITIAVHEEIVRRTTGGIVSKHIPSKREMAKEVVNKGFQSLSKRYHPDKGGDNENQKQLTSLRLELLDLCEGVEDTYPEDAVIIRQPTAPDYTSITDDDIPF